jgi:hypothetical protein
MRGEGRELMRAVRDRSLKIYEQLQRIGLELDADGDVDDTCPGSK